MAPPRRAYAKLNLALSVGAPLPPAGMHPIASWMHCIDLFDDVEVTPLPPGAPATLDIRWAPDAPRPSPIDWPPDKDLGLRALNLLEAQTGRKLPASIRITKRIPVGGGLGGGSSDAAAVLLAAAEAFDLPLSTDRLADLSRTLGSDIAYFISPDPGPPPPAVVTGLGDRIERTTPVRGEEVALILPSFGCPTGAVYSAYDTPSPGARPLQESRIRALAAAGQIRNADLFNDLSDPAESVRPQLRELRERAAAAIGRPVHMTGSGSTLFVPGPDAASVCGKIRTQLPDVVMVHARLV